MLPFIVIMAVSLLGIRYLVFSIIEKSMVKSKIKRQNKNS